MAIATTATIAHADCSPRPGLVAIIASAGGIPALFDLLGVIGPNFPVPIVVAQHLARGQVSNLDRLLAWRTGCDARWIDDADMPRPGIVHVVRPGQAAAITPTGFVTYSLAPYAAGWLELPDILFESVARHYGVGGVGVVLSGMVGAGIKGLRAIRARGGIAMAQSAKSAQFQDMPAAAIDFGKADIAMSPANLARALRAVFL